MNTATTLTPLNLPANSSQSPILDDENYRLILKAKIIQNKWRGTKKELYNFWSQYFPSNPILIQDNQDMTMNVQVVGMTGLKKELVENGYIVPKPAGVRVNYVFADEPVFAYDFDTEFLQFEVKNEQ
jgi:hypothetical protein